MTAPTCRACRVPLKVNGPVQFCKNPTCDRRDVAEWSAVVAIPRCGLCDEVLRSVGTEEAACSNPLCVVNLHARCLKTSTEKLAKTPMETLARMEGAPAGFFGVDRGAAGRLGPTTEESARDAHAEAAAMAEEREAGRIEGAEQERERLRAALQAAGQRLAARRTELLCDVDNLQTRIDALRAEMDTLVARNEGLDLALDVLGKEAP